MFSFCSERFCWREKHSSCLSTPAFGESDRRSDLEEHKACSQTHVTSVFLIQFRLSADKKVALFAVLLYVDVTRATDESVNFLLHFLFLFRHKQFNFITDRQSSGQLITKVTRTDVTP